MRELTAAVRHPGFNRDRWRIGLAGLLLFAVAVIVAQFEGRASAGMSIFRLLAWILWVCCIFLGSAMTADTLSRERREGTLGLLFLTPLNAWDVVIGKLTSGASTALYRLLTLTPMLTCCLLLGGILGSDVLTVVAICLNTLFLSLALGIFISSTQTDDRTSFSLTFTVFMGLSVLPYGLDACLPAVLIRGFGAESAYLILSPAYPLKILASPVWMGGLKVVPVASAVLLQHVVAWMLLGMTASRLRHVALNRPPSAVGKLWDRWRQRWLYGSARSREASRRQLLAIHPIVWLGLRHRRKQPYVWLMFGLLAAVTGAMASYLNDQSATPDFLIGYFFFALAMLKIWVISETSGPMRLRM